MGMKLKYWAILGMDFLKFKWFSHPAAGYGVHSPLAYEFTRKVLYEKEEDDILKILDKMICQLKKNRNTMDMPDLGASSRWAHHSVRSISSIARHSSTNRKNGRFLFSLARWFSPDITIELGTCLGIGTMYLAKGHPAGKVITVEGLKGLAGIATTNFKEANCMNISLINKKFDDALPLLKKNIKGKVLIYIDGNHRYDATLRYFDFFYSFMEEGCILIDDIRWSLEMRKTWFDISGKNDDFISIDLFDKGLVFIKKGLRKQYIRMSY